MLIQSLEKKTKLALMTVLLTIVGNVVICGLLIVYGARILLEEPNQVYVLDGDKGVMIHKELDSLLAIESKTHEDSIQIIQDYRQLQRIIIFLKKGKE